MENRNFVSGAGRAGDIGFPDPKSRRGVPSGNVAVGEGTNSVNTGRETSGERAARFYFSGRIKFFETRLPDAPDEFISAARCGCGEERTGRSDGKKRIAEKKKRRRAKRYDHVPISHYKVKNPIFYDTDNLKTQTNKLKNYI